MAPISRHTTHSIYIYIHILKITFITALTQCRLIYFGYFASGPLEAFGAVASYGGVADVPANDDPTIRKWRPEKGNPAEADNTEDWPKINISFRNRHLTLIVSTKDGDNYIFS